MSSREDIERMGGNHLDEMEKFLLNIAEGRIGQDDLSGCGIIKLPPGVNSAQEYEEYYNDEEDYEHEADNEKELLEFNVDIAKVDKVVGKSVKLTGDTGGAEPVLSVKFKILVSFMCLMLHSQS